MAEADADPVLPLPPAPAAPVEPAPVAPAPVVVQEVDFHFCV